MRLRSLIPAVVCAVLIAPAARAQTPNPWVISTPVAVTQPMEVQDVVIVSGGDLLVSSVPEPGFRIAGSFTVTGTGRARFTQSVVKVMSTFNGQYQLAVAGSGVLTVDHCTYSVPAGVQHALVSAESGRIEVSDSDCSFLQFVAAGQSEFTAERLNGMFECIVQDDASLSLTDIPREAGAGSLWVWPTFMPGSRAVYSPPLPGFIDDYAFPPADATGILDTFRITRCDVRLWPLLVREGSDLTLRDISADNWVVVGLHLPSDTSVSGLFNGRTYADTTLPLADRTLRLQNASVDTWNLYPEKDAHVDVSGSVIGEMLAMDDASVTLTDTTVDGSGGFFAVQNDAVLEADGCTFTCDVQTTGSASAVFRDCALLPYPQDPTGTYTRLGIYDKSVAHLDRTSVLTNPVLGQQAEAVFTWITDLPPRPPGKGDRFDLHGYAAVYSLDPAIALKKWKLKKHRVGGSNTRRIGKGRSNVENGYLGTWKGRKPRADFELTLKIKDTQGRIFESVTTVPGAP